MKKIIVLGSGLVGSVIAKDLSEQYQVTSVDLSKKNLDKIESDKINKISTASIKDGGEGAVYIFLKNKKNL